MNTFYFNISFVSISGERPSRHSIVSFLQWLLPPMVHGWHGMLRHAASFSLCCHPRKPQAGVVLPQTDTTRVPASEAMCMLDESMESMTSRWAISASSSFKEKRPATDRTLGDSDSHCFKTVASCPLLPKRKMRVVGWADSWRTTCCIFSRG